MKDLRTVFKDAGRMREIVGVLAKHGFGPVLQSLRLTDDGLVEPDAIGAAEPTPQAGPTLPRRLRRAIEELGPTYIKLGQILSTRSDLVPPEYIAELQHLQDRVPPMPFESVREMVESELGRPLSEAFEDFTVEPLASASIAQVHRARLLQSGREVVVKVQRPGLAPRIDADLNVLVALARQAEKWIPDLALMDPVGVVTEFDRALRKELDFTNERSNIGRFHATLGGFEGVRIPEVFEGVSSARVLTMELIPGRKVTQAATELDLDPYPIARRMLQVLFQMVFRDGFFHGDLHPGNILIDEHGTIGLIDFGLVGRLNEAQRDNVMDILIALSRQDYRGVARIFFDLGIKVRGVTYDYEAFEADVTEVMEHHVADKTLSEIDIGAFFGDLVKGAIRHRIKMPPSYTMVFKALMTVEGIGKQLAPQINFIEEARPFVESIVRDRYDPARLMKEGADSLAALSRFLRVFPHVATHLLMDAQRGNLTVRVQNDGADGIAAEYVAASRRQARAIGFAGAMLAGAVSLDPASRWPGGLTSLSIALFVTAGWIGFPVFARRFWKT